MLTRWLRPPLVVSPLLALAIQLALAGVAAACSGGADFPFRR